MLDEVVLAGVRVRQPELQDMVLDQVKVLTGLAGHLPGAQKTRVWQQALAALKTIDRMERRVSALVELAPQLPEPTRHDELQQALVAAQALADGDARAMLLACLAPHLPAGSLPRVLGAVLAMENASWRVGALADLAPHLSGPTKDQAWQQAVAAVRAMEAPGFTEGSWQQAQAVTRLMPLLPQALQHQVLREMLSRARTGSDAGFWERAVVSLAPYLPESLLRETLDLVQGHLNPCPRAILLADLASCLSGRWVEQALKTVLAVEDPVARARALARLARHLPPPLRDQALRQVLADVLAMDGSDWTAGHRALALAELAPHLPEPARAQAVAEALAGAEAADHDRRVPESPEVLDDVEALDRGEATDLEQVYNRAHALTLRATVLALLIPHLMEPVKSETLRELLALMLRFKHTTTADDSDRATALALLIPHLMEPVKSKILRELLALILAFCHTCCPEDQGRLLADLAEHFPEPLQQEALATALAIILPQPRTRALAALARTLARRPPPTLYPLWREVLALLAVRTREDMLLDLQALLPVILALGTDQVAGDMVAAVEDVGRWWP
jgi:hypothetical protein